MLTIRLARVGKTKQAQYRMVVADHRRAVTGRFIDVVGTVNPRTDPATVTLQKDEISTWLQKGAQPSETVRTILIRESLIDAPKQPKQRPSKAPKRPDKFGKPGAAPVAETEGESAPADAETPAEESTGTQQPQTETPQESVEAESSSGAESETEAPAPPDDQPESPPEGDTQT